MGEMTDTSASYEGMEYLDDGGYVQPFRASVDTRIWLPMDMARKCFSPNRLATIIILERPYLQELEHSIRVEGLRTPAKLHVDKNGRMFSSDGHHRFLCMEMLGHDKMPFNLQDPIDEIGKYGLKSQKFVVDQLRSHNVEC